MQVYGDSLMWTWVALDRDDSVHWVCSGGITDLVDYNKEWLETC